MKSDREKLQEILNRTDGSFESIVLAYMIKNQQEFDTRGQLSLLRRSTKMYSSLLLRGMQEQ